MTNQAVESTLKVSQSSRKFSWLRNHSSDWIWVIKDSNLKKHTKYPRDGPVTASIYDNTFWPYNYIIHQAGTSWQTNTDTLYIPTFTVRCNTAQCPGLWPNTDGEPDSVNAVQPSNADSVKEDTFTGTSKPEDCTTICLTTNRSEHKPSEVPSDIQINEHDNAEQQWAEHLSDYCPQLEISQN